MSHEVEISRRPAQIGAIKSENEWGSGAKQNRVGKKVSQLKHND